MKKLYYFPVTFTNPFDDSSLNYERARCYIFEDEGEARECYSIYGLASICHLDLEAFQEFREKDYPDYITAMAFVEMCFYSPRLLSYTSVGEQYVSLPALQKMAYDLLGAAANAHWPAQAMINKELKK